MPADEPTGRTTDHASKLDSSHAGEHGRRYRLSLEFGAADDRQAHRLGMAWAGTAAAEWNTRNPIVTPVGGEQRDRIAAVLVARRTNGLCPLNGPCEACDCFDPDHRHERDDADAVVAALPELTTTCTALCRDVEHERDELAAEATRLTNRLTALEATGAELLARAETAEEQRDTILSDFELYREWTKEPPVTTELTRLRDQIETLIEDDHESAADLAAVIADRAVAPALERQREDARATLRTVEEMHRTVADGLRDTVKQLRAERDTAQAAITRVRALHSPEDRGTGPECTGCRTHVTFTPYEKCKTIAALNPPSAPEKKTDHG